MSPKPDVSDECKTQISIAMETFAEKGFHKTRMSDIAETSGLSKGSLYWYFDSKESIILNLLDRFFEPEFKEFKAILTDERPALDRVYHYADRAGHDIIKDAELDADILRFHCPCLPSGNYQKGHQQILQTEREPA